MTISPLARTLLALVAALLLAPALFIPAQSIALLEQTHGRRLRPWPEAHDFIKDPVRYFRSAREWLADRAFPIVQASILQNKFRFYVLGVPPGRRITFGKNGFICLNGPGENEVNGVFEYQCLRAHSNATVKAFAESLPSIAQFSRARKIPIDIVLFPILPSLYGEYLPASVPEVYRNACLERSRGHSPLLDLPRRAPVNVVYPLLEMLAARDDVAFFPNANWHAAGLSLKTARDAYLARLGVTARMDETLERGEGPSEILSGCGITKNYPVYFVRNSHVQANAERNAKFRERIAHLFTTPAFTTQALDNTQPIVPESVLMISDSFGERAAPVFAGAFQRLFQVTTNEMRENNVVPLIDGASQIIPIDRVILLTIEGNTGRIVAWSKSFAESPAPKVGRSESGL